MPASLQLLRKTLKTISGKKKKPSDFNKGKKKGTRMDTFLIKRSQYLDTRIYRCMYISGKKKKMYIVPYARTKIKTLK